MLAHFSLLAVQHAHVWILSHRRLPLERQPPHLKLACLLASAFHRSHALLQRAHAGGGDLRLVRQLPHDPVGLTVDLMAQLLEIGGGGLRRWWFLCGCSGWLTLRLQLRDFVLAQFAEDQMS